MKRKNVLVLTYWSYRDALVQSYTLPYVRIIRKYIPESSLIYLVTFEQQHQSVSKEDKKRIKDELKTEGIIWIYFSYSKFGTTAIVQRSAQLLKLLLICFQKRIDYIHAWCTPAGAIGYLLSVITGKTLIVDSFEPHAEVMVETHTWRRNTFKFRFLFWLEKLQALHAKKLIVCTHDMKDYCKRKFNVELKDYYVKPACVNLDRFDFSKRKNPMLLKEKQLEGKIVAVYAGKFGGLYLTQEVFDLFKVAYDFWNDKLRILLLTNESDEKLNKWMQTAALPDSIVLKEFVAYDNVADYIGLGDFGISPYVPVPSRKYSAPIKNAEYMALGMPIIITNDIADDSSLIEQHEIGYVLKRLDKEEYFNAVKKIDELLSKNSSVDLYGRIRSIAEKYKKTAVADNIYKEIYGS